MISTHSDTAHNNHFSVELRSNLSMTLDRFFAVFLAISTVVMLISLYYLALGLWPVMLISLLHVVAVGWCFRSAWRNNWFRQFIRFKNDTVTIEHKSASDSWQLTWPTTWLRIVSNKDKHKEHRVYLCQHNQKQEVGSFLPQNEREQLEKVMRKALTNRTGWTTPIEQGAKAT